MSRVRVAGVYGLFFSGAVPRVYIGSSVAIVPRWGKHLKNLCLGTHPVAAVQAAFDACGEEGMRFRILRVSAKDDQATLLSLEASALRAWMTRYGRDALLNSDRELMVLGLVKSPLTSPRQGACPHRGSGGEEYATRGRGGNGRRENELPSRPLPPV